MPFSYDRAWQGVVSMFRADWALLLTLTGVFVFFPAFALFVFAPMPEPRPDASSQTTIEQLVTYYQANMVWFVLVNAIGAFGQAAILSLLLDRARPTVSEALARAGALFPSFFAAQMITNLVTGAMLVLLVPGIYLLGRFAVVAPLLMARRVGNPLRAIVEGWHATEKRGWRVAGLILLVVIVSWITMQAATSALTIFGALFIPESGRVMLGGFAGAFGSAAIGLLMVVLCAAIYRELDEGDRVRDVFS